MYRKEYRYELKCHFNIINYLLIWDHYTFSNLKFSIKAKCNHFRHFFATMVFEQFVTKKFSLSGMGIMSLKMGTFCHNFSLGCCVPGKFCSRNISSKILRTWWEDTFGPFLDRDGTDIATILNFTSSTKEWSHLTCFPIKLNQCSTWLECRDTIWTKKLQQSKHYQRKDYFNYLH
jgi:hypothetical protein